MDKVRKSGYSLTDDQFNYYIDAFERNRENRIFPSKDIFSYTYKINDENKKQYTFKYLENLIDRNLSRETMSKTEINTHDDEDIIYNQNGIVIWNADTRQKCIKYGQLGNNYCVARNDSSNMFYSYRYQNRLTFYFVLDKTKKESDPFSFFSIAVHDQARMNDKSRDQYYVTDRNNRINQLKSWNFIINNNENIKDLQYLFKPNPLSKEEYGRYDKFKDKISHQKYRTLTYDDKLFYIQMGHPLTQAQFKNSNTQLQDVYIQTGNSNLEDLEYLFSDKQKKLLAKTLMKKGDLFAEQNGWKKNIDGTYDVNGNVRIDNDLLYKGKMIIKFGNVDGNFYIENTNLRTLEGAPKTITGMFSCRGCTILESLEGAPKIINSAFDCSGCKLLESLKGAPESANHFYCYGCSSLESLEGAPQFVRGRFYCYSCESLKTLYGAPKNVGDEFTCLNCPSLKSLDYLPKAPKYSVGFALEDELNKVLQQKNT